MTDHSDLIAELLPCPFCGGTDLAVRKDISEDEPKRWYAFHVFCRQCHCHGRNNYPIGWAESVQAAHEAWNDRPEAQSLSLSEAREEIERLKGLVAGIREIPQETSGVEREAAYRRAWEAGRLSDLGWEIANQNATPLSELAELIASCKAMVDAALENGPPVLADANTNPAAPDLSSLRKGAEVAVKPLEWDLSGMARGYPAKAVSIFGNYTAWEIEDGFWMPPEAHCGRRAGVGLQSALDAAQSDFETRIRSALVQEGGQ